MPETLLAQGRPEVNREPNGYVQLWRKSLESSVWQNHNLWRFWTYCLMKASYKEHKQMVGFQEVMLQPGQFVFGRKKASKEIGFSEQEIRTCLLKLKNMKNLTIKTTNKFSIITIVNWGEYQGEITNKSTNNQPTTNQQLTTNNKGNKGNKDNINILKNYKGDSNNGAHSRGGTRLPTEYTDPPYDPELEAITLD